jgi:hypothetical protein
MRRNRCSTSGNRIRDRGFFCNNPLNTGFNTPARSTGSGRSVANATNTAIVVSRVYGARPSTASYNVAPNDHRSDSNVETPFAARSGAIYRGDPRINPVCVSAPSPSSINADPKSVNNTRPSSATNTLLGLTSRCTTPARCAASNADNTANPTPATSAGGNGPLSLITCNNDRAGTYSITIHGRSSPCCTS